MVYFFYCDKDGYARIEKGVKMRLNKYLSDAGVCSRRRQTVWWRQEESQ